VTDRSPIAAARVNGRRLGIGNPVLFSLCVAAGGAVACGGFVSEAPNRLVSGRPIALWTAVPVTAASGFAVLGLAILAASVAAPRRLVQQCVLVASAALLLLLLATLGGAARRLAAAAPEAARFSPAAAFWIVASCAALAVGDALQRLGAGPAARAAVVAALVAGGLALACFGSFDALSIAREYESRRQLFGAALVRHVVLVAAAVGPAAAIGFPLGIGVARRPRWQAPVFAVLNTLQTVPSVALFGLLIAPLSALATVPAVAALGVAGIGPAPAIIALILYALLPVVRNTAAGIAGVDPAVVDAARGMGMTRRQVLWRVELPLAAPVLLAGLRIVIVQAIGLAVVAALIGAGGLGTFVFEGLGQYAVDLVLLGALPAIFLAFAADLLLDCLGAAPSRRRTASKPAPATLR
jgi:osmoprotectant transport system permease protein